MLAAVGIRPRLFIAIVGPLRGSGPPVAARPPRRLRASPPRSMGGRRLHSVRGPLRGWGPRSPLRRRPRPGAGPPRPAKSRRGSSAGGSGRAGARLLSVSLPALCPPLRRRGRGQVFRRLRAAGRRAPGISYFPPRPSLKRPKEGLRPFLWKPCLETDGRWGAGCLRLFRAFWFAGDEVGRWPGRSRTSIGCSSPLAPVGAGLCPRPASRVDGGFKRICRGRPVCRPGYGSRETCQRADTQIRPYTGWGVFRNRRGAAWKRTLPQRSGTEPAPYRGPEQA